MLNVSYTICILYGILGIIIGTYCKWSQNLYLKMYYNYYYYLFTFILILLFKNYLYLTYMIIILNIVDSKILLCMLINLKCHKNINKNFMF